MNVIPFEEQPVGTAFKYTRGDGYYYGLKTGDDLFRQGGKTSDGPLPFFNTDTAEVHWKGTARVITKIISTPKKGPSVMFKDLFGDLRGYLKENRDLLFTVIFVLILDEYVFSGAFRERVKALVEGFLKKAEVKHGTPATIDIPKA